MEVKGLIHTSHVVDRSKGELRCETYIFEFNCKTQKMHYKNMNYKYRVTFQDLQHVIAYGSIKHC